MARFAFTVGGSVREIFEPRPPNFNQEALQSVKEITSGNTPFDPAEVAPGWLNDPTHGYIPPAPGPFHVFDGSAWQHDQAAEDAAKETAAGRKLGGAVNRVLLALLWDMETRLRAAGQASAIPEAAAATTPAEYAAALKALVRAEL